MLLNGTHHETADFKLLDFESGASALNAERDWLKIRLDLVNTKDKWHVIDPALTSAEVMELAHWLCSLSNGITIKKDLYFLEPILSFHLLHSREDSHVIKVCFRCELKPSWAKGEDDYSIVCRLSSAQLNSCALGIYDELMQLYFKGGYDFTAVH